MSILLNNCTTLDVKGTKFLNGFVDPKSLEALQLDSYQRALLEYTGHDAWQDAYTSLRIPPIQLGMRGTDLVNLGSNSYELRNPVFIIDGQQRSHAARMLFADGIVPLVGAIVETGTTWYTECERFIKLNSTTRRVTGSELLRAFKHEVTSLGDLYELVDPEDTQGSFVLRGRVAWDSVHRPDDLISGMTLAKVALYLHLRFVTIPNSNAQQVAEAMTSLEGTRANAQLINNVHRFFELVHELWGIGGLTRRDRGSNVVVKATFLYGLARLLGEHADFWDGEKLSVKADYKKRLRTLQVHGHDLSLLCKGSTTGTLVTFLKEHMNKRLAEKNYLTPFTLA